MNAPHSLSGLEGLKQHHGAPAPKVYFLCQQDEGVYVGKTISVEQRVKQHRHGARKKVLALRISMWIPSLPVIVRKRINVWKGVVHE